MSKDHVLCLGNIAYDLILKKTKDKSILPISGYPGGSVFNTALLLSKVGCPVAVIAKTGNDFLGEKLIKTMEQSDINVKYVFRDNDIRTALAIANVSAEGNSSYIFYRPERYGQPLKSKKIPDTLFRKSKVLHTGSAFTYKDETYKDALYFIKKAKEHNVFVSYDPNWRDKRIKYVGAARKRIKTILEYADLIKLSDTDALGITGAKTLEKALKRLPDNIIVTLGAKGAFSVKNGKRSLIHAFNVKVADTIGAGDAFAAGLICEYLRKGPACFKKDMKQTMIFASACAALVCTKPGATLGIKNLQQVLRSISVNKKKRECIIECV